ncbi:hypothetical protein Tco_1482138 [Tanacetum coccineum]
MKKNLTQPTFSIIAVDILKQTELLQAFTLHQQYLLFTFNNSGILILLTGKLKFRVQLDEHGFNLNQNTTQRSLQSHQRQQPGLSSPPTPEKKFNPHVEFVNEFLGYPQGSRALTSGFERPRAPVLQILWGIVNRAHIDYAERVWEEFTQSIHTFTEDKRKLAQHTLGKKKATLILIPSIRFTKLIIFHLQRLHNFHPRPNSPLHLPTEEPVLGHLKFSAKGSKREVSKPVTESSEDLPLAKRAKVGKVVKKRTAKSSKRLVDEFVDEGVPAAKPSLEDTEEAILQKVLQESLTDAYPTQRGPLPPVVFREPDTGKLQPLPEVPGKGKEKVGEEQAAQVLLNLHTPKKKSSAEQYIFQSRSQLPTVTASREESSSLYAELGLSGSDTESDEGMPSVGRSGTQDEGQAGLDHGALDEGQAGSDRGTRDEGQAGSNPESLQLPTPSVHAGPNLEHSDVEITDPSSQPLSEHMDEGFTATAYPDVQENLKLTVDEQVIPEEPVSSTGTLSSLQHLAKDFSFGDQFLNDKPSEADNEKTTADTEAESMVSITIQQDTSIIPPMTSPVIDLVSRPDSPNVHWPLPTTTTTTAAPTTTTTTTTLPLPPQPQQGSSESLLIKRMGELEQHIANLVDENQALETRLTKAQSIVMKMRLDDDKAPSSKGYLLLPPHLILHQQRSVNRHCCPSSSKSVDQLHTLLAENEQALSSDDEVGRDHVPTVNLRQSWWKPLTEDRPATPEPAWTIPSSDLSMPNKQYGLLNLELTHKDLEGPAFEIVKVFHHDVIHLQFQMEECHKLLTDQVVDAIIRPALSISKMKAAYYPDVGLEQLVPDQFWIAEECKYDIAAMYGISHWWVQRQRFYIDRFSSEGDRRAVRTHMRILSVVQIEVFYMYEVQLHEVNSPSDSRQIFKEFVIAERDFKHMYPSDFEDLYLLNLQGHLNHLSPEHKKILTTAVNLWTRNLVIRHRVEDFQLGIESYQTQLNLTKPRWEATGFEFKHDYTVIDSPRAVTFRDRYGVQMIMRFNEIHKFSDGTLQQIDEALDYRVKEFQINRTNPGMNTRFWTKKDVDRSKPSLLLSRNGIQTRRIFRESGDFYGGRIEKAKLPVTEENRMRGKDFKVLFAFPRGIARQSDLYKSTHDEMEILLEPNQTKLLVGDHEILLKMNLPDHRIKHRWRWRHLVPVESIHHPMLTLIASK